MYIDRILFPIETLGPGKRLVLWTKGCTKRCEGCANPELWDIDSAKDVSVDNIKKIILNIHSDTPIDGITFTGGDPLEQADAVLKLIEEIKPYINDVLLYTGYELSYIMQNWSKRNIQKLFSLVSVLIDGPYIGDLNDNKHALIGSTNQKIHFLDKTRQGCYNEYLNNGRKIQNVYMGDKLISVGIHNK